MGDNTGLLEYAVRYAPESILAVAIYQVKTVKGIERLAQAERQGRARKRVLRWCEWRRAELLNQPTRPFTTKVYATGVAVGRVGRRSDVSNEIEAVMLHALQEAQSEGVTDPAELRGRMMAAREKALRGA